MSNDPQTRQTDEQSRDVQSEGTAKRNGEYERAPEDFESDIDTSDATVPDHPVIVDVPNHGQASVYLVSEEDLDELREENNVAEEGADALSDDDLAGLLRDHYVSPSFDGLTGEDIRNSKAGYYADFLAAIAPELVQGN